jgi:hypothetical protein
MIRGILNGELECDVNDLPFVYDGDGYCYDPNFFDWMEDNYCNVEHSDFWDELSATCFSDRINKFSEDQVISIMNKIWDKWVEYKEENNENDIPPKPEWLITAEDTDYIELDDIVL